MDAPPPRKPRLLVFIVAYNAERTIEKVLTRIPPSLLESYEVEVLVIDDGSRDATFDRGLAMGRAGALPFPLTVLVNPVNQGYGGNQKLGFHYAIEKAFDLVALVHGDGQYAPELLPTLCAPVAKGEADAVFGSRLLIPGAARRGGMPLYKLVGNRILTWYQNLLLGTRLSEFHSGYRVYAVPALRRIPFDRNADAFHFDTEIIIQLLIAGQRILELPIPTYYGDEICHVNGLRYAWDVVVTTTLACAQRLGVFHERRFDCRPARPGEAHYALKTDFESPHTHALAFAAPGERVLDVGCGSGRLGALLEAKGCRVTGVDQGCLVLEVRLSAFHERDLEDPRGLPVSPGDFDCVLLLDVIEHLRSPERFVEEIREGLSLSSGTRVLASTGNIGFLVPRLMLLLGAFNYGPRGILDRTHTRLFTRASFRRLFTEAGFQVLSEKGVPAPFPLAFGDGPLARLLLAVNRAFIHVSIGLFAYQVLLVLAPRPSLRALLAAAERESRDRASARDGAAHVGASPQAPSRT